MQLSNLLCVFQQWSPMQILRVWALAFSVPEDRKRGGRETYCLLHAEMRHLKEESPHFHARKAVASVTW